MVFAYYEDVSSTIGRVVNRCDWPLMSCPSHRNRIICFDLLKIIRHLRTAGVYRLYVLVGKAKQVTQLEHERYIRLRNPEKHGFAEHCWRQRHQPDFRSANVIAKPEGFWTEINF